ncbi:MAG TPA: HAMP domain-containing sensor histidine kinase [Nitrososphaeraceae archaeon]|nr:HAMP domain-containing sensor histidine kinase [Nitrososphaeraceae archaeon]
MPISETAAGITEVLHGGENTANRLLHVFSRAMKSWDACGDSTSPSVCMGYEPIKKAYLELTKRQIKIRFITEINRSNLSYCKELMKISELRHLDGVKGNFGICDKEEYLAAPTIMETQPAPQLIYSNIKEVIEQQQYVFDSFWSRSISSEQKIREIEEGVVLGSTELVLVPLRIQELFIDLVKSAKQEILLILPTTNAFLREYKLGIIQSLKQESVSEHNINVRILTPTNDHIEEILKDITLTATVDEQKKENENFVIRRIDLANEIAVSTVTIAVSDRKISLVIEKKDDTKEYFMDAVGLATYSTSKPTVSSYVSIFENLWAQTELYHQLKVSNQQIALANEQLKIHDRMQKQFINVAAHELKTPTQGILGFSDLLKRYPEKREEITEAICRNATRLQRLINDILDVTKIESQNLRLNKEQLNLNTLISSVVEDHREKVNEVGKSIVKILVSFEQGTNNNQNPISVEADKSRLTQVISNLLNNAIKFTLKGHITISTEKTDSDAIVRVKDTGSGIDPEIYPRLFSKFASKSYQGTGLGLFISKSIVEAHGGKIWVENNKNENGVTFIFTLPLK